MNINRYKGLILVFISGFLSMGFEMIAGFIISPIFGSSVFVWGSVIGSVLLGLSSGYFVGGKISEYDYEISDILLVIYFSLSLILGFSGFLGEMLAPQLAINYGNFESLIPSVILFGSPAFLFGIINPLVISEFKGSKGEASGNIFAFSTLGSITGVYVTTFYLIPFQGVDNSVLAFSLICLVLGFYAKRRISVAQLIFLFVILFAIFSMLLVSSQGINFIDSGEIIHEETSQYRTIQIVDYSNGVRSIKFKGGSRVQSAIDKDNKSRIVLDYLKYSSVPFLKDKSIEKTLIIGGGGFVSPRIFSDISESNITVVEVDRLMYELSQEYMYYSPEEYSRVETIIEDGRTFIERTNKTYDYILIDAFTVESVPPHMTTKEYYESIKSRLSEDGYLVVNLVGKDKFFRAEYKTINSVFEGYNEYWFSDGNQVLVFTRKNLSEKRVNIENKKYNFKNIYSKTNDTSRIYTEDVPIITDNKNPSEVFSSE